jgi:hypothetical protein
MGDNDAKAPLMIDGRCNVGSRKFCWADTQKRVRRVSKAEPCVTKRDTISGAEKVRQHGKEAS